MSAKIGFVTQPLRGPVFLLVKKEKLDDRITIRLPQPWRNALSRFAASRRWKPATAARALIECGLQRKGFPPEQKK